MDEQFYTVEQIAQMLSIHPKTIQRYIREGKLRAAKIGKSWRVSGHDLSRFTEENGNDFSEKSEALPKERAKASAVIDIKVSGKDEADRLIISLTAAMNVRPPEYGQASMSLQFLEADRMVRISIWGNIQFMSAILTFIDAFMN